MSKFIVFALLTCISFAAKAEQFTCHFTEPLITVTLDTSSGEMSWSSPEHLVEQKIYAQLMTQSSDAVRAKFTFEKVKYTLALDLNTKGSDGMSDFIYPVEARLLNYWLVGTEKRDLFGGCYSDLRKKSCPVNMTCG